MLELLLAVIAVTLIVIARRLSALKAPNATHVTSVSRATDPTEENDEELPERDREAENHEGAMRILRGARTGQEEFFFKQWPDKWADMRESHWALRKEHAEECVRRGIPAQPFEGTDVDAAFEILRNAPEDYWKTVQQRLPYGPSEAVEALGVARVVAAIGQDIQPRLTRTAEHYLAMFAGERAEETGLKHSVARARETGVSARVESHIQYDVFLKNVKELERSLVPELVAKLRSDVEDSDFRALPLETIVADLVRVWAMRLRYSGLEMLLEHTSR